MHVICVAIHTAWAQEPCCNSQPIPAICAAIHTVWVHNLHRNSHSLCTQSVQQFTVCAHDLCNSHSACHPCSNSHSLCTQSCSNSHSPRMRSMQFTVCESTLCSNSLCARSPCSNSHSLCTRSVQQLSPCTRPPCLLCPQTLGGNPTIIPDTQKSYTAARWQTCMSSYSAWTLSTHCGLPPTPHAWASRWPTLPSAVKAGGQPILLVPPVPSSERTHLNCPPPPVLGQAQGASAHPAGHGIPEMEARAHPHLVKERKFLQSPVLPHRSDGQVFGTTKFHFFLWGEIPCS